MTRSQEYNRLIRAQQDAEYEESLAADRARAEQAAATREAEAREAAEKAAREAAEHEALQAAQWAAAERADALLARQAAKAAMLAPEPAAGPGTVQVCACVYVCRHAACRNLYMHATQILLRFPDGKRLQRRFDGEVATLHDVYDWAEAEGVPAVHFKCAGCCAHAHSVHVLTRARARRAAWSPRCRAQCMSGAGSRCTRQA